MSEFSSLSTASCSSVLHLSFHTRAALEWSEATAFQNICHASEDLLFDSDGLDAFFVEVALDCVAEATFLLSSFEEAAAWPL
jgi:hypothetical protein